jgi:hypothetical protein
MTWARLAFAAIITPLALAATGCGSSGSKSTNHGAPSQGGWGSYPVETSLDEREVVRAYVEALDTREGARFCRVVAPWISGRFDLLGTDPDAFFLQRPLRCPRLVTGFIGYIEDCCPPEFVGAAITRIGTLRQRGDVIGVPITVRLRLDQDGTPLTKMLDDVVWVTKDSGAWRVAKLSEVAAAASIRLDPDRDLTTPPNVDHERRSFAAAVAKAKEQRREREDAYREVEATAACPDSTQYEDAGKDVRDYLHPAPPTPTPQLPAADIRAVRVAAREGRLCVLFELAGKPRRGTTFDFTLASSDYEWGRTGFRQKFEIELRADGRALVTSGRDQHRHAVPVPGVVGMDGNRLMLLVDGASFASGRPLPGSEAPASPVSRFEFSADATVVLSQKRYLHDDLGELGKEHSYP